MSKIILAVESDLHAGHKLGLCNPETAIQEEDEEGVMVRERVKLTKVQEYLWQLRSENIEKLQSLAGDNPIIYVMNGDLTNGMAHPEQLMTTRLNNQLIIARDCLLPILDLPNIRIVRLLAGTGVHSFGEGSSEAIITEMLKAKYPNTLNVQSLYHWTPTINGIKCNFSHHGPGVGRKDWLKGNAAQSYLRNILTQENWQQEELTRLSVHSHYHTPVYRIEWVGGKRHMVYITPSMCGLSDYGRKATGSEFIITHGMTCWIIDGSEISEPIEYHKTLDIRTKEIIGNDERFEAITLS